jgi:hypothetical protein
MEIFLAIIKNKIARTIIGLTLLLLIFGAIIGYFSHKAKRAQQAANAAQTNANLANQKAEGLQILINSNNQAAEIERDKTKANEQATNSNSAVNNLNDSLRRDSGDFSGNYDEARKRFCKHFPADSRCRLRGDAR